MNKICKTCKKSTAGDHGHCPKCYNALSLEAKKHIENTSLRKRGHILENTLNNY